MQPAIPSNFYERLNISHDASSAEIKQARDRLARQYHPDKVKGTGFEEMMKAINEAYSTLNNPKLRRDYDLKNDDIETLYSNKPVSEGHRLHVGKKWSEEFIQSIKRWMLIGEKGEVIKFTDPSSYDSNAVKTPSSKNRFTELLVTNLHSIEQILQGILPIKIWNWTFSKIVFDSKSKEILAAKYWDVEIPTDNINITPIQFKPDTSVDNKVNLLLETKEMVYERPTKQARALMNAIYESDNSSKSFFNPSRQPAGTKIPLCPNTIEIKKTLGIIPEQTVKGRAIEPIKNATGCSSCADSFGIFLWEYNCASCGSAFCDDCTTMQKAPDYVEPVRVCFTCRKENPGKLKSDWLAPFYDPVKRPLITSTYLALIEEMGFVTPADFLAWETLFFADGNFELAVKCAIARNEGVLGLASKMALLIDSSAPRLKTNLIAAVKCCLQFMTSKDWLPLKLPGAKFGSWEALGDHYAKDNPNLALICYAKTSMKEDAYLSKWIRFTNFSISGYCFSKAQKSKSSDEISFTQSMAAKNYSLALTFAIQGKFSLQKWTEIINGLDLNLVETFVAQFSRVHDVKKTVFKPDRDHYRWPYLNAKPDFQVWLGYLEELLKKGAGAHCISYFRKKMANENFVVWRDQYAASGNYFKMLLCHCLISNRISWEELGKKWFKTNEPAALAAYLCSPADLAKVADSHLQNSVSFALRCYLQIEKNSTIQDLVKSVGPNARLLCKTILWKQNPSSIPLTLELCHELKSNPSHLKQIKDILLGCLKKNPADKIAIYKLLTETGLSDQELLGLITLCSTLNLNTADFTWLNQMRDKLKLNFRGKLYQAIQQYSLKKVFELSECMHPLTEPVVKSVLNEFKIDELPHNSLKSVCLVIRALSSLSNPDRAKLFSAMNDLTMAMLCDPTEDSMKFYSLLMDKLSRYAESLKLRGPEMQNVQAPDEILFADKLQRTPDLKVLIMHKQAVKNLAPLDAAMSNIDLCMAVRNAPGMVGGFLSAALELLKAQQKMYGRSNESYAYRKAIVDIVHTAYSIGSKGLCPATKLYMLRASIAILTQAYKKAEYIGKSDQILLDLLYREADQLSKVVPLVMNTLMQTYDLIYLDLIYREFISDFLDNRRKTHSNPIYQYYILEGTLGWIDQEKYDFETERVNTMQALLQDRGNTMSEVEQLMSWPGIPRDNGGWLPNKPMPLNLSGSKRYNRVYGIRLDINTGNISYLFGEANGREEALFDENDVSEVMKLGVGSAFFSLDPPSTEMTYHPFQEMVYAPKSLKGTNYLATMLHADMVMKWLSMGTEVSGMAPFALRDADKGLYLRLPERLRRKFIKLRDNVPESAGKAHRFWIEAGDVTYYIAEEKGVITYFLNNPKMEVKKHLLVRDQYGKQVDAKKDDDTTSKQAKFARLMTKEYDNLGKAFPELLRLKEYAKLQALSRIVQNSYRNLMESRKKVSVPRVKISNILDEIRGQIKYPQAANVESIVNKVIRESGYNAWQVPQQQVNELRKTVSQQCADADAHTIGIVADQLQKVFHTYPESLVESWLDSDDDYNLVSTLQSSLEQHEKDEILNICSIFKRQVAVEPVNISGIRNECLWVPAAFRRDDAYQVYGGVSMSSGMIPGGAAERSWGVNSLPPKTGGSATGPNARPYYIEGCGPHGQLYGSMVGVDRITGNSYRIVDVGSCVRDQYNAHQIKPNVSAYWGTYVGYTNVHHYTRHTNGATHFHYTNGQTQCTNAQGNVTTYQSNQKGHRC